MRLLRLEDDGQFSLVEFVGENIPCYAVLSHTWGSDDEEVTFNDLVNGAGKSKAGYRKIRFCGKQAANDGLQFFWVDTCCIDKSSSAEVSEAINSMFRWYQDAARCYVYLSDVSVNTSDGDDEFSRRWKPAFKKSRWFTRGWTLQELIAPASVEFFSEEKQRLGNKQSLEQTLHETTGIAIEALRGSPLSYFSVDERMSWAAKRQTKREEDEAYSLLGIFDIHMPLIYGEGREKAFVRLQKEIKELLPLKEERKRMLLDSLRFNQIDSHQMTIKNAHARTCKWLLKRSEYLDWLDTTKLIEHHGFLWIKGKPGTGKSTLMKFALTNAYKTMKGKIVISFFFNARGEGLEKSTVGTYRSLLLQLLERLPALQCIFDSLGFSMSTSSSNHQWSVESLKALLEQTIQSLGESSIVCFIDALDECEEWQIRDMISFFEHVGELTLSAGIKFHVCFSSRHYPRITIRKGLYLVLEGQEGHNQDIIEYLDSELKIGSNKLAEQVRTEIQEKASGIFMWVVLVVGILKQEYDSGRMHALRRRLQEIPSDLHELFRDILTRDSRNKDELVLCVQWVLFARQLLSPEQLYFAILSGVEPEALSRWDSDETPMDVIERFILSSSKGLAEITKSKSPKVQFIHESVKDFLMKENGLASIWPDLESNFQGQSHERLKQCCLNYMGPTISVDLNFSKSYSKALGEKAIAVRELTTVAFPLLEYAVRNLLYHADMAEGGGISQANFVQRFPLANWVKIDNLLEKHEVRRHTERVSLLYILAEGNMSNLIRGHPSILSCLEVENERYGPPLFAALATRGEEAVRTFVEAHIVNQSPGSWLHELYNQHYQDNGSQHRFGRDFKFSKRRTVLSYLAELGGEVIFAVALKTDQVEVDLKDKDGQTPLSWAARNGHEAVVKLLLETGKVDVDSKDKGGWTPLWWAAENRNEAVVKLLLETGKVDVDSKDKGGRTPLWRAVVNGRESMFKMLLETGKVDVDSMDKDGQTPLSWAAENGNEAVVKLLLEIGKADVDLGDSHGRTPLSWAARNGHEAIVKLLLETGKVDVDSKNSYGRTPLSWAARNGHEAVVKLLLATGKVDVDSKDNYGRTPLLRVAESGYEAVAKLLLTTGKADVDSKDKDGQTPLRRAAENRHEAVVKLLLETGKVDVDSKDKNGQTPLWWATGDGHGAAVKLLLKTGKVDVDSKDKDGRTPLWRAARYGNEAVVKLLLETGKVDVDSKDKGGQTPLWWAARDGHEAVVKLLLETGKADVDSKDKDGWTPLWWAAENRNEAVVKLLLATGKASVDSKDKDGRTPLWRAVVNGREAMIKLLLETGKVGVDSKDNYRRTPLWWAVMNGCEAVVKLLLETGKVDVDSKDKDGRTPLSWAAGNRREAMIKLLLETGKADVDSKDKDGRTPLSWAAGNRNEAAVKLLLATGKVYVDLKDKDGRTPLSWAAEKGHEAVVKLLRSHVNLSQ
ncbi:MAG: hypothetical protein M1813_007066 [Trichoglossum hirsutum]|nr:MAG: hypothetical protein M1813_007066 [Trichoglossum hirsutum]